MSALKDLSRRERQILEILYTKGRLAAAEIQASMPDAPSYSAVRATLRTLEEKGHVKHKAEDLKYVYYPAVPRDQAKRSAVQHLLGTFFSNSPEQVVAALLDVSSTRLTSAELDRMSQLIEAAKKEGK